MTTNVFVTYQCSFIYFSLNNNNFDVSVFTQFIFLINIIVNIKTRLEYCHVTCHSTSH